MLLFYCGENVKVFLIQIVLSLTKYRDQNMQPIFKEKIVLKLLLLAGK